MKLAEQLQSAINAMRAVVDAGREAGMVVIPGPTTIRMYGNGQAMDTAPKLLMTVGEIASVLIDGKTLMQFESIEEAAAEAVNHLRFGCLYWTKGGVFLTAAQMATFSREWQALFRELAGRGWRISKCAEQSEKFGAFVVKISGYGVDIRAAYVKDAWVVHRQEPLALSGREDDDRAQHLIGYWSFQAERGQQGGAA